MRIGRNTHMNKTNVPFDIIESINELFLEYKNKISVIYNFDNNESLTFKSEVFPDKFWFTIVLKPVNQEKVNMYFIKYFPTSITKLKERNENISSTMLDKFFKHWLDIVDKYENSKTFLDDPFIEKYQKDIHDNFLKFVDEEDDDLPYDLNTQIQFIEYLDNLEVVIKEDLNNDSVEFKNELNESLKLICYIKENINKLTKGEVKQKFSLSLANIAKASLSYFQEIMKSVISEVAVKTITEQL